MIEVLFDPPAAAPAGQVARETVTGLRADGSKATASTEAVDARIVQYGDRGQILADGLASEGLASVIAAAIEA